MAEHSKCHAGRPIPMGVSHVASGRSKSFLGAFHKENFGGRFFCWVRIRLRRHHRYHYHYYYYHHR